MVWASHASHAVPPRAVAIGCAAAIIALWVGVLGWVSESRHHAREALAQETRALAATMAAQLGHAVGSAASPSSAAVARSDAFAAVLKAAAPFAIDQAMLVHDNGAVLAASADEAAAVGTLVALQPPRDGARVLGLDPIGAGRILVRAAAPIPDAPLFLVIARKLTPVSAWQSGVILVVALAILSTVAILAAALRVRRRPSPTETRMGEGVEHMADGFLLWDADERLVAWNARYLRLLPAAADLVRPGIAYEALLRALMRRMRPEVPDGPAFEAMIEDLLRGHRDPIGAWEIAAQGGRQLEVEETRTPSGGIVAIYRDVTDRRRQLAAQHKALQAERDANLLHRRFVTMAGHEFRTPLAVIDGAAQRLLAVVGASAPSAVGRIERIRGAVSQLSVLIDRLLSSTQVEEAQPSLETETTDLGALLAAGCEAQRKISPRFDIELRLPAVPVQAELDRRLVGQAIASLLSNAVKYSGASRRIDVELAVGGPAGDEAVIRVTDRGVGIPSGELEHLFTRFFRASTAEGTLGTGTGLHLARQIVDLHGGRIEVESEVGNGTTFTLRLPLHRRRAAA